MLLIKCCLVHHYVDKCYTYATEYADESATVQHYAHNQCDCIPWGAMIHWQAQTEAWQVIPDAINPQMLSSDAEKE